MPDPAPPQQTVQLVSQDGARAIEVPASDVGFYLAQNYRVPSDAEREARVAQATREAQIGTLDAAGQGVARGFTLGASDAAQVALGGDVARQRLVEAQQAHPVASAVGEVGGQLAPALLSGGDSLALTPIGALGDLGEAAGAAAGRAGVGAIGRAATAGAVEGAGIGLGQGVSQLSLSDDPVDVEHVASALSSNMLYGAAFGGAGGAAAKGLEVGLSRASAALHAAADGANTAAAIPDDLAGLDAKGLRAAKQTELDRIEAERVPQRQAVADEIASYRQDVKANKLWVATKGSDDAEIRVLGKRTLKADRQLDNLLDNPKRLALEPQRAMAALQQQEAAFDDIMSREGEIRSAAQASRSRDAIKAEIVGGKVPDEAGPFNAEGLELATDREMQRRFGTTSPGPSAREQALDRIPSALERNRQLQQRIADLVAEPKSPRLSSIADAQDALSAPRGERSFGARIAGGAAYGKVATVAHLIPGGSLLAPAAGAIASKAVSDAIDGIGPTLRKAAGRTAGVVDSFLGAVKRTAPAAPVLATDALRSVRYAPPEQAQPIKGAPAKDDDELAQLYAQRSAEIRSQTMYDPTGKPVMRPEARAKMAQKLDGLRSLDPVGMDRLETAAAARIEYLASALPRKPDPMANGPDLWRPSELEMRSFARKVDAAEHPEKVEQRLVDGTLTPEDVEAYRACYPARAQALEGAILSEMGARKTPVSYERRLALSMFTGRPMDPSMDPRVLSVLQATFVNEDGTQGGTRAPVPKPQFGSVRADVMTPSQDRESTLR